MAQSILQSDTTRNVVAGGAISATGVAAVLTTIRTQWPELVPWPETADLFVAGIIATVIGAVLSRIIAFWRHPKKMERYYAGINGQRYRLWPILLALGAAGALQGCATTLPAVGGKTHYNVEFSDVTAEQSTNYKMNIRAPAGVELASMTGMQYGWKPDGSGEISVSQDQTSDSTAQAALISEVNRQQVEAFQQILSTTLNALAPYLGQYLDARVRQGEIEAGVAHDAISRIPTINLEGSKP